LKTLVEQHVSGPISCFDVKGVFENAM
jgi:hypothetical protein